MEIQSIILLIGITILVLVYMFKPLVSKNLIVSSNNSEYSQLVAERERIINILKELDFDQKLGKIPEDDYASQRAELVSRGGILMEKIDLLTKSKKQSAKKRDDILPLSDKDIEQMLEKRRAQKSGAGINLCPECSKPILPSDRFCPSCGNKLTNLR
jgi:rubrerythrin